MRIEFHMGNKFRKGKMAQLVRDQMRNIASVLYFALLTGPVLANDGPTYDETVNFIQAKTSVTKAVTKVIEGKAWIEEASHCQFIHISHQRYTEKTDYNRSGPFNNVQYSFDLSDFDPSRVEIVNGELIYLNAKENRYVVDYEVELLPASESFEDCMNGKLDDADGNYQKSEGSCRRRINGEANSVYIDTFDADVNAPKLQRAFQHLIRLCGGEEELF